MVSNNVKKLAHDFCKKHKVLKPSYESMSNIAESLGYLIVEFNFIYNEEHVSVLIEKLKLDDAILREKGFTYVDSKHRLIFVNEDLSNDEKLMVLTHELGHIVCNHFSHINIIGLDVQEENQANEFAHYILVPEWNERIIRGIRSNRKQAIVASIAVILIIFVGILSIYSFHEKKYYGEYYITESGQKYHEKECIFVKDKDNVHRLTEDEFETGDYEPCQICLPN